MQTSSICLETLSAALLTAGPLYTSARIQLLLCGAWTQNVNRQRGHFYGNLHDGLIQPGEGRGGVGFLWAINESLNAVPQVPPLRPTGGPHEIFFPFFLSCISCQRWRWCVNKCGMRLFGLPQKFRFFFFCIFFFIINVPLTLPWTTELTLIDIEICKTRGQFSINYSFCATST